MGYFEKMDIFIILTVTLAEVYTDVKTHQTIQFIVWHVTIIKNVKELYRIVKET
jgi:hypothetical protein